MGTIGAVLTTQMQEQTIFVSEDGERFDNKEDCLEWERLRPIIKATADIGFGEREEAQDVFWWRLDISQEDIEKGYIFPFLEWLYGNSSSGLEKLEKAKGLRVIAKKLWSLEALGPSSG